MLIRDKSFFMDTGFENLKTGRLGEAVAVNFLVNKGFSIIERNYQTKIGEIDIIAEKDNVVFFIEVKSTAGSYRSSYRPIERIGYRKQKKLKKLVELCQNIISGRRPELWAIEVFLDSSAKEAFVNMVLL